MVILSSKSSTHHPQSLTITSRISRLDDFATAQLLSAARSPPYTRFLNSGVDFAIVSQGMPRVHVWVQEFLIRHEIPCVSVDYLVEYVCNSIVSRGIQIICKALEFVGSVCYT